MTEQHSTGAVVECELCFGQMDKTYGPVTGPFVDEDLKRWMAHPECVAHLKRANADGAVL